MTNAASVHGFLKVKSKLFDTARGVFLIVYRELEVAVIVTVSDYPRGSKSWS